MLWNMFGIQVLEKLPRCSASPNLKQSQQTFFHYHFKKVYQLFAELIDSNVAS